MINKEVKERMRKEKENLIKLLEFFPTSVKDQKIIKRRIRHAEFCMNNWYVPFDAYVEPSSRSIGWNPDMYIA